MRHCILRIIYLYKRMVFMILNDRSIVLERAKSANYSVSNLYLMTFSIKIFVFCRNMNFGEFVSFAEKFENMRNDVKSMKIVKFWLTFANLQIILMH